MPTPHQAAQRRRTAPGKGSANTVVPQLHHPVFRLTLRNPTCLQCTQRLLWPPAGVDRHGSALL